MSYYKEFLGAIGFPFKPKHIKTFDHKGNENGEIIEICKIDNSKVHAYISTLNPGVFKGFHQHTKITQTFYVTSRGKLLFILYLKGMPKPEYHLVGEGKGLIVPPGGIIGIKNYGEKVVKLLCIPDPPYNLTEKHEMNKISREELEENWKYEPDRWSEYVKRLEGKE